MLTFVAACGGGGGGGGTQDNTAVDSGSGSGSDDDASDDSGSSGDDEGDDNSDDSDDDNGDEDSEGDAALDPGYGLVANDLTDHPMQDLARPGCGEAVRDPEFGTLIRRIGCAADGEVIKPMYSTIQAWNADESRLILYNQSLGVHQLFDGMSYEFLRNLDDIRPRDIEQIFWDFNDPDNFYYIESSTTNFMRYSLAEQQGEVLVNVADVSQCNTAGDYVAMGNDIQMMSRDSDVFGFRCGNRAAYAYRLSTGELTEFDISDIAYVAPMPAPSGELFYHDTDVYSASGYLYLSLNEAKGEHASLGSLPNGDDAHFAVAFAEGPQGGCLGNIVAHRLATGDCFALISEAQGYAYPKSGTHISALAYQNPGWLAASMIGYEADGQSLLDQELVLVYADEADIRVYRIGHHRADEDEFDYWGEPHAVISPSGTRVLFGSDWSGADDGKSVDTYVVELPAFEAR